MKNNRILAVSICGVLASASAHAAVLGISSINGSPAIASPSTPITTTTTVTSITTSEGTFSNLVGVATASNVSTSTYFYRGSNPGSSEPALQGLLITASVPNANADLTFSGGSGVTTTNTFFIMEIGGDNTLTLKPINSSGTVLGSYSLAITGSNYGALLATIDNPINSNTGNPATTDFAIHGATFTLADFGGSGDLTGFAGFNVEAGGIGDPVLLGAVVPEPSTVLMSVAAFGSLLLRRRRPIA